MRGCTGLVHDYILYKEKREEIKNINFVMFLPKEIYEALTTKPLSKTVQN